MPSHPAPARRSPLRVLHLEDSELDHELEMAHLRRGGTEVVSVRVDSEPAFRAALEEPWDIVLSDFNVPGFSGLAALEIVKALDRPLPFILISGEIGEDVAVAAMRNGASDYLLKANLARLAPAVEHAIDANEARLARERADHELVDQATQAQIAAMCVAQQATRDQSAALNALNQWVAQYLKIAKIALRERPEYVEKLGGMVRSARTAAQRGAPKKAAATRAMRRAA